MRDSVPLAGRVLLGDALAAATGVSCDYTMIAVRGVRA
jgi:hypothetical protein